MGLLISYDSDIKTRYWFAYWLLQRYQTTLWVYLLAMTAITNHVMGLLISYYSDIKPSYGFAY